MDKPTLSTGSQKTKKAAVFTAASLTYLNTQFDPQRSLLTNSFLIEKMSEPSEKITLSLR
jgi:hypothetical protein